MEKDKSAPLNVRLPKTLKKLMLEYIALDTHQDVSEFTRDAIRQKIERDAPHLYKKLFLKNNQINEQTIDLENNENAATLTTVSPSQKEESLATTNNEVKR
jgi:Arc/MetJ-type ribon-helix-helix transcriptional regulator